jgi:predicted methyltransferase
MQRLILPLLALAFLLSGNAGAAGPDAARLAAVLQAQPSEVQARYPYRHPAETLTFFEVGPGMSVVEALPGGGWYTRILLPYLGPDGALVGADYSADMYPLFGFFTPEQLKEKETWVTDWPLKADEWGGENSARLGAFVFGSLPAEMNGSADVVLFIRALHNLARFESQGGFLTAALQNAYDILKPGGILGVVQHQAPEGMPDGWAGGQNGYLEKAWVIARLEEAGFEFVAESDINENPKDQPGPDDIVWRLPPTYATSRDNPELKAEMDAIGESNRMTLKFRKPAE